MNDFFLLRKKGVSMLLLCLLMSVAVYAQTQISGKVVGADDSQPIAGASVLIKGNTTNGAITGADGTFRLTVGSNAVLVISYIGYQAQEVNVGSQTTFNISLVPSTTTLGEVVVTGYSAERKKDITGSV